MTSRRSFTTLLAFVLGAAALAAAAPQAPPGDWPQWQGPDRTGLSKEVGLLQQWPSSGPPLVWSVSNLGTGYGSVAIKGDRIFVQSSNGKQSIVASLNRADGKGVWSKALGPAGSNDRGSGPRATPTTDGDRIYVLTESGDLWCLKAADGAAVWQRNILKDFNGRNIQWLLSESPLVDGNMVIVTPGGRNAGIVALDKMSGATIWTAKELSDEAGYASVIAADVQGVRTLMTITGNAAVGVRAVGWQADVAVHPRRQRHRQHHDADLSRQQGVLHVGVRHRRRAARVDRGGRRGEGEGNLFHRASSRIITAASSS